jgi:hypothetical protein
LFACADCNCKSIHAVPVCTYWRHCSGGVQAAAKLGRGQICGCAVKLGAAAALALDAQRMYAKSPTSVYLIRSLSFTTLYKFFCLETVYCSSNCSFFQDQLQMSLHCKLIGPFPCARLLTSQTPPPFFSTRHTGKDAEDDADKGPLGQSCQPAKSSVKLGSKTQPAVASLMAQRRA